MRAWSCITSYPLRGLPYLAYDNVNLAMVNSMMLRSSMLEFEKVYSDYIISLELFYRGNCMCEWLVFLFMHLQLKNDIKMKQQKCSGTKLGNGRWYSLLDYIWLKFHK